MSGKAPSASSPSSALLNRFYPHLLVLSGVAVALGLTYLHNLYVTHQSAANKKPRNLRRRNARRVARPRASSYPQSGSGSLNAAVAESLAMLDGSAGASANVNDIDGGALGDGISTSTVAAIGAASAIDGIALPQDETITTMLNNAGVAARGNRGEGDGIGGLDHESEFSYMVQQQQEPKEPSENQNVLQLLYLIAEDQARQQGYVHRGVTCNLCNVLPITGIRYRCSNCIDFDLCESCEAQDAHPKTHLFYKVRIPAPFLGNPKKTQPPVYPGKPSLMSLGISSDTLKKFTDNTGMDQAEIEALYEQFKCLAATEFPDDPNGLNGAINRVTFDKCFVPNNSLRPPPPNLIYDRMFAFYDTDGNGLIGFEEFIQGLSMRSRRQSDTTKNRIESHRRVFRSYDLNDDGYIERRDVLRMFRAYYALQKDLMKDLIAGMDDEGVEQNQTMAVLAGSQPISAAFAGGIPAGDPNRRIKTQEDEENDVPRQALAPDQNELGRRSETIEMALADQRREAAEVSEQRRMQREERRRLESQHLALSRITREQSASGAAGSPGTATAESQAGPSSPAANRSTARVVAPTNNAERTAASPAGPPPNLRTHNNSHSEGNISPTFTRTDSGIVASSPLANVTRRWSNETRSPRDRRLNDSMWGSTAGLSNGFPHRRMSLATPQLAELNFDPSPFAGSPFPEWSALNLEEEPGRQPSDAERKLYYLDDYYRSEDEDEEDEDDGWKGFGGMGRRRRLMGKSGLDKEEDVGREILCQVTEQGINELLDLLFLSKEKEALEAMKGSQSPRSPIDLADSWTMEQGDEGSPSSSPTEQESPGLKTKEGAIRSSRKSKSPRRKSRSRSKMSKIKAEIKERGGPGRISEDEFVSIMKEESGRKLSFMSTWVNMGSF